MPTVLREANGSFIVRENNIPILESQEADLRAYELRLRDVKSTRVKPLSAAMNKQVAKISRLEARKAQEIMVKQEDNTIRNLLNRGVNSTDVKNLLQSLNEMDRRAEMWEYVDRAVRRGSSNE